MRTESGVGDGVGGEREGEQNGRVEEDDEDTALLGNER